MTLCAIYSAVRQLTDVEDGYANLKEDLSSVIGFK